MDIERSTEIIAAFVDGEPVDPELLKRALSDEVGRDYLIDVVALRRIVVDGGLSKPEVVPPRTHHVQRTLRWLTMAAALLACLLGGYIAGHRSIETPHALAPAITTVAPVTAAPAPTRVIRLKEGVDWNERAGGG